VNGILLRFQKRKHGLKNTDVGLQGCQNRMNLSGGIELTSMPKMTMEFTAGRASRAALTSAVSIEKRVLSLLRIN
jgi:hypothetical protein